jgi:hypothetical protein
MPTLQVMTMNEDEINFFKIMVFDHQDIIEIFPTLFYLNSQILVLDLIDSQKNSKKEKETLRKM